MVAESHERLRAVEAARYLRISRSTLSKWRMKDEVPPYHRCGPRLIIYHRSEIDAWLANGESTSSDSKND